MGYLYTRKKFSWDASDFAMYGVVASLVPAIGRHFKLCWKFFPSSYCQFFFKGNLLVLPLLSGYFQVHDWFIGVASLLGNIGAGFTVAFAPSPLVMYLCKLFDKYYPTFYVEGSSLFHFWSTASIGTVLGGGIGIVINSTISKIVKVEELGLAFEIFSHSTGID